MVRVLQVVASGEKGGAESVVLNIIRTLDRSRYSPHVLLLEPGPLVGEIQATGTAVEVIESGRVRNVVSAYKAVGRIAQLIADLQIDLVHSHNSKAHLYGGLAATIARVPSVFHLHGVPKPTFTRDGLVSLLSVVIPASSTLAVSAYVQSAFLNAWPSHRTITVVHNGVCSAPVGPASSYPSVRQELGIPSDAPIVLMATRLQYWKGVHILLDAAARVTLEHPDAWFLVVGGALFGLEKDYESELHARIEFLKLGHCVRLIGYRSDVTPYYLASDLVVHCSIEPEPFGMVIVEAMRCHRPVVAADLGGPREIIENGVSGLLIPPGNVERLAESIVSLLKNSGLRARMSEAAAARVSQKFRAESMVEQLEMVYEGLVPR